ncbi:MAG: DUF1501 domain-containing protein [Verrucomicrobia bacterium]|nr:DUF1501 domain-containing protein [Verrucomicrobiota bacterium]
MESLKHIQNEINRRTFLRNSLSSLGLFALGDLLAGEQTTSAWRGLFANGTQSVPKVKRIIHLCMAGGASHLETFDYKPEL